MEQSYVITREHSFVVIYQDVLICRVLNNRVVKDSSVFIARHWTLSRLGALCAYLVVPMQTQGCHDLKMGYQLYQA